MTGVILVTYANRGEYLQKVIEKLLFMTSVETILLIGNNTPYSLEEFAKSFQSQKIKTHSLDKNTGSANGYKIGIEQLITLTGIEFIWLLDDDNLPDENALTNLLNYWKNYDLNRTKDALMCLRTDRPYLVQVAHGKPVKYYFPKKNAFLGFHIFRAHEFFIKKIFIKYDENKIQVVSIPCAPYGGLFFHKNLIQKTGYPDERFFVYADDYEFTYRITKAGGKILLLPDALVDDLEKTWFNKTKHGLFHSRFLEQNNFRAYYSVRNTVHLQRKYLVTNKILYTINKQIFIVHLFILARLGNKMKQFRDFRKAVADGNSENFDNTYIYEK